MSAYATRVRDLPFMGWVKQQPCLLAEKERCDGPTEADHAGERGLGRKSLDCECIALCQRHHLDRTDSRGFFSLAAWLGETHHQRKDQRRAWVKGAIRDTQRAYLRAGHEFLEPDAPKRPEHPDDVWGRLW